MRYEHIELDISTAACSELLGMLSEHELAIRRLPQPACDELVNFENELRARLQRRDADPHAKQGAENAWLDA
jgi:hypothetical protein